MPSTANENLDATKVRSKECKEDDTDTSSVQPFDSLKKKWMITASNCDYNELVSLLKENPSLAGFKVKWLLYYLKPNCLYLILNFHCFFHWYQMYKGFHFSKFT